MHMALRMLDSLYFHTQIRKSVLEHSTPQLQAILNFMETWLYGGHTCIRPFCLLPQLEYVERAAFKHDFFLHGFAFDAHHCQIMCNK